MSVYEIAACTTIAATPEQIWAILDDIPNWPVWMPETQNLTITSLNAGQPRHGYRFRMSGKVVYATMEVTTFTRLERGIHFRLNMPPLGGDIRCKLIPMNRKLCRMERVDRLMLPGPVVKFLDKTQRARFERLAGEFLTALKETVQKKNYYGRFHATRTR